MEKNAASASSSSAWTLLGVSGYACKNGLAALWLFPGCVGGFLLNWYLLAPRLQAFSHRTRALTATEALVTRLDGRARRAIVQLASLIVLASLLAYVASQFQAAGKSFREAFAMSDTASIVLGAVGVVVVYTVLGGFWAVSLTDCVQGLLMVGAEIVVPAGALVALGPSGLADGLRAVEQPSYLSLTAGMARECEAAVHPPPWSPLPSPSSHRGTA